LATYSLALTTTHSPPDVKTGRGTLCWLFTLTALGMSLASSFRVWLFAMGRIMNTSSKLGPHTQTDRGTCPGVGL
jgi:hypothetical protein